MYEFWYDYGKKKIWRKDRTMLHWYRKLGSKHKNTFFKDIAEDIETRFDTANYQLEKILLKGKNSKVISGMENELLGKIMKERVGLRLKTNSYLTDEDSEDKKIKRQKNVCHKTKT